MERKIIFTILVLGGVNCARAAEGGTPSLPEKVCAVVGSEKMPDGSTFREAMDVREVHTLSAFGVDYDEALVSRDEVGSMLYGSFVCDATLLLEKLTATKLSFDQPDMQASIIEVKAAPESLKGTEALRKFIQQSQLGMKNGGFTSEKLRALRKELIARAQQVEEGPERGKELLQDCFNFVQNNKKNPELMKEIASFLHRHYGEDRAIPAELFGYLRKKVKATPDSILKEWRKPRSISRGW